MSRLVLVACLLAATGCAKKRASRNAPDTVSSSARASAAGGYERGELAHNRSCTELTSDAEALVDKMSRLASRRKKALLVVPKTVLSIYKRATGRAESAEELARQYEQRRARLVAINTALQSKGCPIIELPSEPETENASGSGSASGGSGSTRARY